MKVILRPGLFTAQKWAAKPIIQTSWLRHATTRATASRAGTAQALKRQSVYSNANEIEEKIRIMRRQTLWIGGTLFVLFGISWGIIIWAQGNEEIPHIQPGDDVSDRYEHIAGDFDSKVRSTEFWMGIGMLRRWLVKRADGHVLEVSVGTGRNSRYYREDQCQSITMVDQSREMVKIAQKAFREQHPGYKAHRFIVQSALGPMAAPPGGFDTIVQTMGICSTVDPVGLLKRMEEMLKPDSGRILLLEHGRGHYDWINERLDYYAPHHAHKFGCWWNKDIEEIVKESGLEIVQLKRYHFGTTWWIELKSKRRA